MIYRPARGSILSEEQAQRYGERLESLIATHNREVTPEDVLNDARKDDSPMHDFFDWDDETAAEHYRLTQARYLLRAVHVVVKKEDNPEEEIITRAFHHVHIREEEPQQVEGEEEVKSSERMVYVHINRVMDEKELHDQIVQEALRQMISWRSRYRQYEELIPIIEAITAVQDRMALITM